MPRASSGPSKLWTWAGELPDDVAASIQGLLRGGGEPGDAAALSPRKRRAIAERRATTAALRGVNRATRATIDGGVTSLTIPASCLGPPAALPALGARAPALRRLQITVGAPSSLGPFAKVLPGLTQLTALSVSPAGAEPQQASHKSSSALRWRAALQSRCAA